MRSRSPTPRCRRTVYSCAVRGALASDGESGHPGHEVALAHAHYDTAVTEQLQLVRQPGDEVETAAGGGQEVGLAVLVPAYTLSELKAAFQIGAVLFLPFLIIDLVVASVTLSVGMMQLPPVMVSAPFKILLFVLVDGWNLVVGSLVKSFY